MRRRWWYGGDGPHGQMARLRRGHRQRGLAERVAVHDEIDGHTVESPRQSQGHDVLGPNSGVYKPRLMADHDDQSVISADHHFPCPASPGCERGAGQGSVHRPKHVGVVPNHSDTPSGVRHDQHLTVFLGRGKIGEVECRSSSQRHGTQPARPFASGGWRGRDKEGLHAAISVSNTAR